MTLTEYYINKINELEKIVEEYPDCIPLKVVSTILAIDEDSLRASIKIGSCPFGLTWIKDGKTRGHYKIATLPFVLFMTNHMLKIDNVILPSRPTKLYKIKG